MSDEEQKDRGKKSWLWTLVTVGLLALGLIVFIGLSAVLIKWGIIVLLVYGAFALGRRLLGNASADDASEPDFLPEGDSRPDALAMLEQDRELDKLKARMEQSSKHPKT